ANNLYGWAMSQYLPIGEFKWLSTKPLEASHPLMQKILTIKEKSNQGCCLEVKLTIPKDSKQKEWADKQRSDTEKLILTLHDKDYYVIHYRNLQQCIREGYVLKKVYQILGFDQSPWMKPYIAMNTQGCEKTCKYRFSETVAVYQRQINVKLNKPEYIKACILDLSKYYMYDFWYGYLKKKYDDKVKLLYTDTDSLIIEIEMENIYQDIIDDCDLFDFSNYSKDHWVVKNLPKDQWIINEEGVHAKCYSIICENSRKNMIKAKDLKKSFIKKELTHKIFEDCILEGKEDQPRTAQFL
ncbi:5147_t:CDS:2, partial [Ambispora gerdemannii]